MTSDLDRLADYLYGIGDPATYPAVRAELADPDSRLRRAKDQIDANAGWFRWLTLAPGRPDETATGRAAPAPPNPHPSRFWLLGLVRGLVESECPDESVRRTLAESLDEYPRRGRPADEAVDLWDVLLGTTGDETRTDPVTARDDRAGRADEVPTTVAFARHLLRVTADRLARTRGFGEESLTVIATRRLAGRSVAEIAQELGEAPEIVRVGLGIIRKQWTAVGSTPAATT